ncbi:hypothetical protein A2U01_0098177, partial [Trifolium medium]|nr:hypothetical protein [Trifolium medium]
MASSDSGSVAMVAESPDSVADWSSSLD